MKRIINLVLGLVGLQISSKLKNANSLSKGVLKKKGEFYLLEGLKDLQIPLSNTLLLDRFSYEFALHIENHAKGKFYFKEDKLMLKIGNGLNFIIEDKEELFILKEVFVDQEYNILLPFNEPFVLIDIGQNVAITSLYFAQRENCSAVEGFELFPSTFKIGQRNIDLNAAGAKIVSHSFGLGEKDSNLVLNYLPYAKGRMGINELIHESETVNAIKENVTIRDVAREFEILSQKYMGSVLVCKVDCEGAEYEIFDRLFQADLVKTCYCYIIEWHYKSPDEMVSRFQKNGFTVFCKMYNEAKSGILYAVQK